MITSLGITQIFVLDQDQALDFYVGKLGLELVDDVDFGVMRWLTVRVPGEDRQVLLERPDPPRYDPATTDSIREMVTKGASGGHLFFYADDAHAMHADLKTKGVELPEEPTEQSYGIDFGFRDPFGNHLRIAQRYADST
ncbi:MAG TPA: VOC family protein [Propionibacteriaceae bacterium]|jgi:catechol 2,3-dioxygenase-like lactoylglutathione lyase family enzyme|nr:VOC family protein [Propionibacteriaceae bacterium]